MYLYLMTFYISWEILLHIHCISSQEIKQYKHQLVPGKKFKDANVIGLKTYRHLVLCLGDCLDTSACSSVAWNPSTGACQLSNYDVTHHQFVVGKMVSDSNWLAYARIVHKVFNVRDPRGRYLLSFSEAKTACEAIGYTLASPADLIEARDEGMDICVCGWVSDNTNVLILQRYWGWCWHKYTNGYEICWKTNADAWCKRN